MRMYDFTGRDWATYYRCLNKEFPVEKCPLELDEEGVAAYNKALEGLIADRKAHPDVPISYPETFELEWGD